MKAEATRKNIEDLREWGHPALADRIEAELTAIEAHDRAQTERVARLEAALRDISEDLKRMAESIPDGVMVDASGRPMNDGKVRALRVKALQMIEEIAALTGTPSATVLVERAWLREIERRGGKALANGSWQWVCPECRYGTGHAPDCRLAAAIGEGEREADPG